MHRQRNVRVVVFVTLAAALLVSAFAVYAFPERPGPGGGGLKKCPNQGMECLDVWDPVTCDNGVTYSNQCYADRACATGCEPGYPNQ